MLSGLFALLVGACTDESYVDAYRVDAPRPMFAAVHLLRGAGRTGKDRVELVASDRPSDCATLGMGDLVLKAILTDWRSDADQRSTATLTSPAPEDSRMRWTSYRADGYANEQGEAVGGKPQFLELRQRTAPSSQGAHAQFVFPDIRVATLPPVDPNSCCARVEASAACYESCPLPTKIERLDIKEDVELCDDIVATAIEAY